MRRQCAETNDALRAFDKGMTITAAAAKYGIATRTLRRALRRRGDPPMPQGRFQVQRDSDGKLSTEPQT